MWPPGWNQLPLFPWWTSSVRAPSASTTTAEAVKCASGSSRENGSPSVTGVAAHRLEVARLLVVGRLVRREQRRELVAARVTRTAAPSSTFSRAARRAGKIAATMPSTIVAIAKTISWATGSENTMKSTRATSSAPSTMPSTMPIVPPISAVITLSCRIIRRTCRRVMPIARSIPSSRVRSKTVRTSVFTIPNRLTITESASST